MAASGSVEQMPWACLRPRAVEPHCVLAGIPPEDMLSFVRLVAQHPFTPFPDASAIARKIHALRDARVEATVALLEYVASAASAVVSSIHARLSYVFLIVLVFSLSPFLLFIICEEAIVRG